MPYLRNDHDSVVAINSGASVVYLIEPLLTYLQDRDITEICINRPHQVYCERGGIWEYHHSEQFDFNRLQSLSTAIAKYIDSDVSESHPILSATLPSGQRIQIVQPPACQQGSYSITIRKPSSVVRTLSDYAKEGFFQHIKPLSGETSPCDTELLQLQDQGNHYQFLRRAVKLKKTIVIAGETGSGKTTLMNACILEIPKEERLITIQDVPELVLPNHPNHVHLFYPSEAKEEENAPVTAASLLKSCLRMKPDRILLAELRGGETFDFLNVASSGHGGSITSCHAGSAALTFERLALMVLQNRQGRMLPYDVIRKLLYLVIDVVVHVHADSEHGRHITEIWFDPCAKQETARADSTLSDVVTS